MEAGDGSHVAFSLLPHHTLLPNADLAAAGTSHLYFASASEREPVFAFLGGDGDASVFGFGEYGLAFCLAGGVAYELESFGKGRLGSLHVVVFVDEEFDGVAFAVLDDLLGVGAVDY